MRLGVNFVIVPRVRVRHCVDVLVVRYLSWWVAIKADGLMSLVIELFYRWSLLGRVALSMSRVCLSVWFASSCLFFVPLSPRLHPSPSCSLCLQRSTSLMPQTCYWLIVTRVRILAPSISRLKGLVVGRRERGRVLLAQRCTDYMNEAHYLK